MREVCRDAGLRVPWFRALRVRPTPEPALNGVGYPCVLKPLSLSASQGVMRANNRDEFLAAAARLRRLLESPEIRATREAHLDEMIVEGYIPGREVAVEGLLTEGKLRVLAIFDKPDPLDGPYFEETIYVTPTRAKEAERLAIEKTAQEATRALGLSHGAVHAEVRVNEEGVWPIEVAPQPVGGLCSRALRFCADGSGEKISLGEVLLRHELGELGTPWEREPEASGVMMIPVPQSGILNRVEGMEDAREVAGIDELLITARIGDHVAAWPEGSSYLGFLFARGESPEKVEAALRKAHGRLKFELAARLPVEHPVAGTLPA
jgi:ATP-grasp domain/L-amino acid ligase C-terminal domain 2